MNESLKVKSNVLIKLKGPDGKVKKEVNKNNLIVNVGRDGIADQLLPSPTIGKPTHIQLGEGTTSPNLNDTELEIPLGDRKVVGATRSSNTVTFNAVFGPGESTGEITEAGIFNASSGGAMYARIVFGVITKGDDDTLELNWSWTIGS